MDDFPDILARDFGFKPQGKSVPMAAAKSGNGTGTNFGAVSGSDRGSKGKSTWNSTPSANSLFDDGIFGPSPSQKSPPSQDFGGLAGYDDVFGGVARYTSNSETRASSPPPPSVDYDSIFHGSKSSSNKKSLPVYDKPVYDDDIFDGVPGLKSSSSVEYDDVFASLYSAPTSHDHFDGLLGNIGKVELDSKGSSKKTKDSTRNVADFDDLIPGFGGTNPNKGDALDKRSSSKSTVPSSRTASTMSEDPFVVLESSSIPPPPGLFTDSSEYVGKSINTVRNKYQDSTGENFDNFDVFGGFTRPEGNKKELSPPKANKGTSSESSGRIGRSERNPMNTSENAGHKKGSSDVLQELHEVKFDKATRSAELDETTGKSNFNAVNPNIHLYDMNSQEDLSAKFGDGLRSTDDIWLTVSEIPLLTLPTSAPPPSRPPPLSNRWKNLNTGKSSLADLNVNQKVNQFSSFSQSTKTHPHSKPPTDPDKSFGTSATAIDEIEDFAMGQTRMNPENQTDAFSSEEDQETNAAASAAAMKEAMDKAEAKFKHAKELRERESNAKTSKTRDFSQDSIEREQRERQDKLDHEREQREKEEYERVKKLEKEREDREKARQAVERATREARERAAAEAKERAAAEARKRAERAAVEKANAEARERAERAAVQRATQEARERAAKAAAEEARERVAAERAAAERAAAERAAAERAAAERAAAERVAAERAAVERATAEARLRAERAAVERVAAEVRERAAAAAAAAAAAKQQRNDNDLESFFDMGVRANSEPRQRSNIDPFFDTQPQGWGNPDSARASSGTSSTIRKASSATNIVDDLTSIFGASASSGELQEVEGESEERRRARLERHQRTLQRTAKALAEKNERDIQTQREQAERHRIGETLDIEIKRWAAGKEGNIRALLSTLQYVLWPECGWQPASLTDLITPASVKKVYRKATLCIHPDKVQQKGANLQQKYIAEKVFDLLKEAWNKFNSEELF